MNTKRRFLVSVLCILVTLICVIGITACNKEQNDCAHTWGEWSVKTDATCTEAGVKEQACTKCGETKEETIAALGHSGGTATCESKAKCTACNTEYGELAAHTWTDATCTAPKTCSVCSATEGEAAGHKGGAADCENKAKCSVCGKEYGEAFGHAWVDATCTAPKTCSACGVTSGELAAHAWVDATCTAPKTCSVCSLTEGKALGHSYDREVVDPTCTEKGYTAHTCSVCGDTYNDSEIDAAGHDWTEPTCAHERTCSGCDATEPALAHNYELSDSTEATCTNPQKDTYTCVGCGDIYTDNIGSELGHDISGVTPTERQVEGTTCDYIQIYVCNTCGEEDEGDRVSHHDYIAKVTTEATCMTDGVKTLTCKDCKHVTTEKIEKNANAHVWNEGTLSGNIRTYGCINKGCNATKTAVDASSEESAKVNASDLAAAGGVDLKGASMALDETTLGAVADKDLTLSAGTLSGDELTAAKDKLTPEQQEQLGNNPIYNFTINDGTENITSFNGGYITITLPYNVPDGEDVDSVAIWYISEGAPVCIEAAYSNGYVTFQTNHFSYYSVTRLTPEERCQVYGHNIRKTVAEATCIKDGYTLEVCIRCAKSEKTNIVKAEGHKYTTVETPATCTTAGNITYTCGCGYSYTTKLVATGHDWEVAETVEPTCTATGYVKNACTRCDAEYKQTTASIKHTYVDTVVPATCVTNGYTSHKCSACGYEYKDKMTTGAHKYENGVCTVCGQVTSDDKPSGDCDHSKMSATVAIDLSEYGACEGTLTMNTCACGEVAYLDPYTLERGFGSCNINLYNNDNYDEGVTDEGNMYMSASAACSNCGLVLDVYAEAVEANCRFTATYEFSATMGDQVILDKALCVMEEEDHDTERSDFVIEGCPCGDILVSAYVCVDCGKVTYISDIDISCENFTEEEIDYTDEDGFIHEGGVMTCKACGYRFVEEEYYRFDGCFVEGYEAIYIENASGERVLELTDSESGYEHEYEYEYELNGESCTDGVTIIRTCSVCGYSYSYQTNNHYNTSLTDSYDLSEYGACGGYVRVYKCPCGQYGHIDYDYECNNMIDLMGIRRCADCGLSFVRTSENVKEGCYQYWLATTKVSVGETVVADITLAENISESHNYEYTFNMYGSTCADGYTVSAVCLDCGYSYEDEHSAGNDYHSTNCVKRVYFEDYGACGGYLEVYACPCGAEGYTNNSSECHNTISDKTTSYVDGNGITHEVYSWKCRDCGMMWESDRYEVKNGCEGIVHYIYTITVNGNTVFDSYDAINGIREYHDYEYTFSLNGDSCEDGYYVSYTCKACGYSDSYESRGHNTFRTEYYDLSEYGACGGEIFVNACPCGYRSDTNWNINCKYDYTSNKYFDEEGNLVCVEARTCDDCGLRLQYSYYMVRDPQTCTETRYGTIVFSANGGAIEPIEYQNSYESHDYENNAYLNEGATSCEDGVNVEYTCRDCGDHYTDYITWHERFVKKEIDLAQYGSVCGGTARYYTCACGEEQYLDLYDGILCDLDYTYVDLWIDGYISDSQYTASGWHGFNNDARLYTCAVTDPEQCAFKVRQASYWIAVEGECRAERYETWQFGYNEETGKYKYELTYKADECEYHRYTVTEINGTAKGEEYVCPDCNSTYSYKDYYDADGNHIKRERIAVNTLDNGYTKYWEETYEYTYYDGYQCYTRKYEKRTYADGAWDIWESTYTFSGGCMVTESYRSSDGTSTSESREYHQKWYTDTMKEPTCTQHGAWEKYCYICQINFESGNWSPNGHSWYDMGNGYYYCTVCGLENINGADGDIVLEDMTNAYGNGVNYVVGYRANNDVDFMYYVSIVLRDSGEDIILDGVTITDSSIVRAKMFSKAEVAQLASALGYSAGEYDVRFVFVPVGADGSFDYSVTITGDETYTGNVTGSLSEKVYVGKGESYTYTITPTQSGTWTFASNTSGDSYATLYDSNGNSLVYNDDGGYNTNFFISYELEAGQTYTLQVCWLSSDRTGYMAIDIDCQS